MKYIRSIPLLFTLVFFSCDMQTVIDLDIPPHEPVLVLNGMLDTDTNVQVVLSHSVGAFSNNNPSFINDANVILYKDNDSLCTLVPDMTEQVYVYLIDNSSNIDSLPMYYYKNEYIPEKDANYRIEVSHNNYNSISAETYIPNDIILYNIDIDTTSYEDRIGLTFSFDDSDVGPNSYRLELFSSCTKEWEEYGYIETFDFTGDAEFMSNDPSFPGGIPFEGYTFQGDNVVFTDALFNGQQKTITLDVQSDFKYAECDTVMIKFATFSDDTYSYYKSLGDHSEKGELGLFGGEIIPVYSNVENGLGVLISINAQRIYLKP